MSRTFRKMDEEGKHEVKRIVDLHRFWGDDEEGIYKFVVGFHGDGSWVYGSPAGFRHDCKKARRTCERKEYHKIYRLENFEDAWYDDSYENLKQRKAIWRNF